MMQSLQHELEIEMNLILNQAQAEAVYSAMCALNNVGGRLVCIVQEAAEVSEAASGSIFVRRQNASFGANEHYEDQSAFATAYGLQQG